MATDLRAMEGRGQLQTPLSLSGSQTIGWEVGEPYASPLLVSNGGVCVIIIFCILKEEHPRAEQNIALPWCSFPQPRSLLASKMHWGKKKITSRNGA